MKYSGMPFGMWLLFKKSFRKNLNIFNIDEKESKIITKNAKLKYKKIIKKLPEFEKNDRFKMNIVSCAMFAAFISNLKEKPTLDDVTNWYNKSMMTKSMKWFCKKTGKKKYTNKDINNMEKTAKLKAADRNPYSWNMEFYLYDNDKGYEARFTKCGICHLLKEEGLFEFAPAMCRLDYTMADASLVSDFKREYTIATGGAYCDCGYYKK
jgi:hypothetical protein